MQCLGGSPGHCTSQHRPAPALHMLSFENFVKSMPPSLSALKVTPSFCFAFKISDDRAVTSSYVITTVLGSFRNTQTRLVTVKDWYLLNVLYSKYLQACYQNVGGLKVKSMQKWQQQRQEIKGYRVLTAGYKNHIDIDFLVFVYEVQVFKTFKNG